MKSKKVIKLKQAKLELEEVLENDTVKAQNESQIDNEEHVNEDHYHGIHHFDKYGNHDDISVNDFSLKAHLKRSKKSLTLRITMMALVLGLSIVLSLIDGLLEKFSINIGGVGFEMRILDLLVIIVGIPIVGLIGSIAIGILEPWFHFLIDSDHVPLQIALDSFGYALTVIVFFFIFYLLFKNSPIHKEPDKEKRIFKNWLPMVVIVPILSIIFTAIFVLALYVNYQSGEKLDWTDFTKNTAPILFANFGVQLLRFIIMYILFVLVENKIKPINHRYR